MADAGITSRAVDVTEHDLPLHCPPPGSPVWMMHPRVFLDVAARGSVLCPYCSTRYDYKGAPPAGH
ncbi:MAG: zinc-finger domain-containing protein [Betaproteobacteria bacterium]|nr:zinc-finger domain-containing protein [Betaproteobacteria bacterium]